MPKIEIDCIFFVNYCCADPEAPGAWPERVGMGVTFALPFILPYPLPCLRNC